MIKTVNLLKDLFENPKNIVLVTDENHIIRYASDSVKSILGVSSVSLMGRNAFDFVSRDKHDLWKNTDPNKKPEEVSFKTTEGNKVYFDVTITKHVVEESVRGHIIFLFDITNRKLVQEKLENENNHLDHFIFKTTHDLRAPLHSAIGLINLAEKATPEESAAYIQLIRKSLLRLDEIILDVSNFYKNEKLAITKEKIDLEEIINVEFEALKNFQHAENIRFEVLIHNKADFCCDLIRLKTILSNILSNSIKYSDKKKLQPFIKIVAHINEQESVISISDNGIGIEEEHLPKIFDIFYRGTSTNHGTGLGLYIVKDTIERLGGQLRVESKIGEGTIFSFTLPNCINELTLRN
jgi:PAS domain S-box-containing protein